MAVHMLPVKRGCQYHVCKYHMWQIQLLPIRHEFDTFDAIDVAQVGSSRSDLSRYMANCIHQPILPDSAGSKGFRTLSRNLQEIESLG